MALFHKYPYTDIHDLNLDWILKVVKEMKDKFDSIDFDYIFNTLTSLNNITAQHTELISQIQGDIDNIGGQILQLQDDLNSGLNDVNDRIDGINTSLNNLISTVATNTSDIAEIRSSISDIRDDLSDLSGVTTDLSNLEQNVDSIDTRVTQLESATFGDLVIAPTPKNFCCNMLDFDKLNYEIVRPDNYDPSLGNAVDIEWGCIRFRGASNYNQTHLVLYDFCPKLASNTALTLAIVFADTYSEYGQALDTTFGALLSGVNMVVGVTNQICVGGAKLTATTRGDYQTYDLHLYVNSQPDGQTWIANSRFYLEWCAILGGVGYLTQGRGSADTIRNYLNAYNTGVVGTGSGPSQSDFDALVSRVSDAEDDIDSLETSRTQMQGDITLINSNISDIQTKNTQQDSSISSLGSRVTALENNDSIETWDNWSDVFDEGQITTNSRIIGFHMQKVGKIVTFEIAGCNFRNDSNHPYSTFCLGTIRSGLRSKLTPKNNIPVTFIGMQGDTDGNRTGIVCEGTEGTTYYCPIVLEPTGIVVAQLFGNNGKNPYTWSSRDGNPAYSLCININHGYDTSGISKNAFVVRGSYVVN